MQRNPLAFLLDSGDKSLYIELSVDSRVKSFYIIRHILLDSSGFHSHCTGIRGHIILPSIKTAVPRESFRDVEGKTAESTAATADSAVVPEASAVVQANSAVCNSRCFQQRIPLQVIAKYVPYHV